ncbi:hypothetical protein SAMN04488503_0237 [Humidesulfovibrio mexicanus]|uniref:Uncharacterized protein n=1 Tax=Humidesulfovibrio mexicanus TaxID=147047 RepID=A0A238XLN1_9BACT|nr:hypothetical protein SAMN04488503_0237 [Humidesulfovibrio mexicanus]
MGREMKCSPWRDAIPDQKSGTPAWKLESNHWPGVFPVFRGYSFPLDSKVQGVKPQGE